MRGVMMKNPSMHEKTSHRGPLYLQKHQNNKDTLLQNNFIVLLQTIPVFIQLIFYCSRVFTLILFILLTFVKCDFYQSSDKIRHCLRLNQILSPEKGHSGQKCLEINASHIETSIF